MRLCQLEFQSTDIEASLQFVEGILGWTRAPVSIQDQFIIKMPQNSPYGISLRSIAAQKKPKAPHGPLVYFESDISLQILKARTQELGGRIISEPNIVVGYGMIMVVEDPGGLRFGLYEAKFEGPRPGQ